MLSNYAFNSEDCCCTLLSVSIKKGDFSNSHSYTSSLRNDEDSDTTRTSSPETSKTSDRVAERTNANEINKNNNKSKNHFLIH